MASVNKTSLRKEFDSLKSDFKNLSSNRKSDKDLLVLVKSLMMLLEVLVAVFLEKTTKKDNKNSSKPSSQTEKDETSTNNPGSNGKGKKENNELSSNTKTKETITIATVEFCDTCGDDLHDVPCEGLERRTKIDIVFEKVVSHVDAQIKHCPTCEAVSKGNFPSDMYGPIQYGVGIKAYILNLLMAQMIPLNRIQKLIKVMIGRVISETSILKYVIQFNRALEKWEQTSIAEILKKPSIHVDETSLRVEKANHWIHVYSSGDITLKFLHRKRGLEAIEELGIIPRYGGSIIHDCWASYLSYNHCNHGLCGSHLLRELTFVIDSNNYAWAKTMKKLLQETCKKVSKRRNKKLTKKEYSKLQKRYRTILTLGQKELPPIAKRKSGQRGKIAKTDAHNLLERLQQYEKSVLLFAKESYVSFTNNRAERDLRMSKVKQKVSGCFRKVAFAKSYCRISSYLQTMANKGHNPLVAIQMVFAGQI